MEHNLMQINQQTAPFISSLDFVQVISRACRNYREESSFPDFISFLREHIFHSLGNVFVEIFFHNESQNTFIPFPAQPAPVTEKFTRNVPTLIVAEDPLFTELLTNKTWLVLHNDADIPAYLPTTGNHSHAFFPISVGKKTTALLYIGCRKDLPFPHEYLQGVQTVALLINTWMKSIDVISHFKISMKSVEYSEQLQNVLYEISVQAHQLSRKEELFTSLHEIVGRVINARNFFIALLEERNGEHFLTFTYHFDEQDSFFKGMEIKVDPKAKPIMTSCIIRNGQPVLLTPDNFDQFCQENDLEYLGSKSYSLIGAPFYLDHLAGVVVVQSYSDIIYSEKDKEFLAYVATHIGNALARKKAIDDIHQANEMFALFMRYSPVHVYIKEIANNESRIVKTSDNYSAALNRSNGDLIGKSMAELFPPEFAAKTTADDLAVVNSGIPVQTNDFINGRTYSTIKFPMLQGNRSFLAGFSIDITERKQMEEDLRQSEQRYRIIFEKSPLALIRFDKEGTIVDFNERFVEIMGSTKEKLLGFNAGIHSTPKMREAIKKALAGENVSFEDSYTSVIGGKTIFLRGLFSPVTPGQSPTDVIATLEDISELKKHEEEQQKIEKLESLGILAGGIAHDFNNILTGIMGNVSFSKVLIDPDHRAHKALVDAEKASKRAAELAQQLLTFAKGGEPNKKIISLQSLVCDAVSLMLRGSNVRPVINIPTSPHAVLADEGQISQVLNNLIINAAQAMPGGGTLTITGDNEILPGDNTFSLGAGPYSRLQIHDTGCGISPDALAKIFDPYYSTKVSGTGLGLATAYSIIHRHKGYVGVASTIGVGTTFTILLPSNGASSEEMPLMVKKITQNSESGSILVMDDEEIVRHIVTEMLSFLGYEVTTCVDGKEAIELYKASVQSKKTYATVIMDLTIPGGLGGKETAEQILAFAPTAHLIVSSGYSSAPVMSNFRQYGFSGAIAKPYTIDEFKKVLSTVPT